MFGKLELVVFRLQKEDQVAVVHPEIERMTLFLGQSAAGQYIARARFIQLFQDFLGLLNGREDRCAGRFLKISDFKMSYSYSRA